MVLGIIAGVAVCATVLLLSACIVQSSIIADQKQAIKYLTEDNEALWQFIYDVGRALHEKDIVSRRNMK